MVMSANGAATGMTGTTIRIAHRLIRKVPTQARPVFFAADPGPSTGGTHGLQIAILARPDMAPGQEVLLFIRPNDVELLPASYGEGVDAAPAGLAAENLFPGVVHKMTYLGDRIDYHILLGDGLDLRVQTDGKVRFHQGENVKVHLPVALCRVILE